MGLEPTTPGTTIRCSNQLSYTHHVYSKPRGLFGTPEGTRTPGLLLRRQLLYPTELLAHIRRDPLLERVMGIEPTYPAWKAGVLPLNYTRKARLPKFSPEIIPFSAPLVNRISRRNSFHNSTIVTPLLLRSRSGSFRSSGHRAKAASVAGEKMENSSPGRKSRISPLRFCSAR